MQKNRPRRRFRFARSSRPCERGLVIVLGGKVTRRFRDATAGLRCVAYRRVGSCKIGIDRESGPWLELRALDTNISDGNRASRSR